MRAALFLALFIALVCASAPTVQAGTVQRFSDSSCSVAIDTNTFTEDSCVTNSTTASYLLECESSMQMLYATNTSTCPTSSSYVSMAMTGSSSDCAAMSVGGTMMKTTTDILYYVKIECSSAATVAVSSVLLFALAMVASTANKML